MRRGSRLLVVVLWGAVGGVLIVGLQGCNCCTDGLGGAMLDSVLGDHDSHYSSADCATQEDLERHLSHEHR
jgi:hypothetical protein